MNAIEPGWNTDGGIHEIPLPAAARGRLWLCGKHAIGPDPEALMERVGADGVVCLNEEYELAERYCAAGVGRAGTTAVAVLVSLAVPLDEALDHVRRHRPMAGPEVGAQLDLVREIAASVIWQS